MNQSKDVTPVEKNYALAESLPRYSEFRRIVRVFFGRRVALVGFVIIIALILTAIFAPWIAPYSPIKIDYSQQLLSPSWKHLLGTDAFGRDIFSRIVYGSRTSLLVGLGAVSLAIVIGQSLGLIAAYFGGALFAVIMRCIDALMAVPMILNALIIAALLGGGLNNVIFALGIAMIPSQGRMMASQVLIIKENDYILASRSIGASDIRMMVRHILPNAFAPLLVLTTVELGVAILTEAGLSFLGIGISPPAPAWGSMVNDGYKYLLSFPILSFAPGIAIMLTVFSFNMVGDGLRDALDPRLRGVL